eukprot:m.17897 g.17897  ORF g.17897 m.17897 type:complete len:71 (-) comp7613_c0_seq1:169-381(-)
MLCRSPIHPRKLIHRYPPHATYTHSTRTHILLIFVVPFPVVDPYSPPPPPPPSCHLPLPNLWLVVVGMCH